MSVATAVERGYVKALLAGQKAGADGRKLYTFRITSERVDRQGEVVTADGWDVSAYMANPVVLDSHAYFGIEHIVGRAMRVERVGDTWEADIAFNDTPKGQLAQQLVEGGDLRAVSVGFRPMRWEVPAEPGTPLRHTQKELLEISVVPVPANEDAIRLRSAAPVATSAPAGTGERRGALAPHTTALAEEDADWDGASEVAAAGVADLRVMCAWFDVDNPDLKGSFKLAHHEASEGHPAVWRGVAGAMAALLGARGGVRLPESDRRAVYAHLARHYRQFGKEPPEFKSTADLARLGEAEIKGQFWEGEIDLLGMEPAPMTKAGRVLSKANEATLRQAYASIGAVLAQLGEAPSDGDGDGKSVDLLDVDLGPMRALLGKGE